MKREAKPTSMGIMRGRNRRASNRASRRSFSAVQRAKKQRGEISRPMALPLVAAKLLLSTLRAMLRRLQAWQAKAGGPAAPAFHVGDPVDEEQVVAGFFLNHRLEDLDQFRGEESRALGQREQ